MLWGNNRAEQQSRKRRGGIKGGKAWWPDSTAREKERKKGGWEGKTGSKQRETDVSKENRQRSKYLKQIKTQTKSQPAK